jgi:hypothetical protein
MSNSYALAPFRGNRRQLFEKQVWIFADSGYFVVKKLLSSRLSLKIRFFAPCQQYMLD